MKKDLVDLLNHLMPSIAIGSITGIMRALVEFLRTGQVKIVSSIITFCLCVLTSTLIGYIIEGTNLDKYSHAICGGTSLFAYELFLFGRNKILAAKTFKDLKK